MRRCPAASRLSCEGALLSEFSVTNATSKTASRLGGSRKLRVLARAGYAANGVLHILIGVIAVSVAFGRGGNADQDGALGALAANPFGAVLLWVMAIGLTALAMWQLVQVVLVRESDTKKLWAARVKELGKAVAYGAVAATAFTYAMGGSSNGDQGAQSASATLLGTPFGVVLLVLLALIVVAIGGYFIVKGARKKFLDDIEVPSGTAGKATLRLGMAGYIAKGVALAVVGVLFAVAAVTADPDQAAGLDGALKALAELPFGIAILTLVGLGFIAYGIYCFVRARRARL
jgi:hypothetical protein